MVTATTESSFTLSDSYSPLVTFYLNGKKVVLNNPEPEGTLLDYIRSTGLTGTKLGCSEGGCGACTVDVASIDPISGQLIHQAVNACIAPLISVEGKQVLTIEGIGSPENPHPAQERIALFHGSQCGFCTPGIVMSLYCLLRNTHGSPSEHEIEECFDGNLCRCTGYRPILDAAMTFVKVDKGLPLVNENLASCGRPGGCCRDKKQQPKKFSSEPSHIIDENSIPGEPPSPVEIATCGAGEACCRSKKPSADSKDKYGLPSPPTSSSSPSKTPDSELEDGVTDFTTPDGQIYKKHEPAKETIFPPALRKYSLGPLCFGNERKIWYRPVTVKQLLEIKKVHPNCKIVGGSSEIQIEIKMKAADYRVSVYANDIPELRTFHYEPGKGITFGSNFPLTSLELELEKLVKEIDPSKAQIYDAMVTQMKYFAGRQIRNVATLAGNIATASPISDMNPLLVASEAILTIETLGQEPRYLSISDFFISYRKTKLPEDGIISKIFVPECKPGEYMTTYKQAKRKDDDIAIVTCCLRVVLDPDTRIVQKARLVYGGMAPITMAAKKAGEFLVGKDFTAKETLEGCFGALEQDFNLPYGVPGGMATYRKTLALSFFYRFYNTVLSKLDLPHEEDAYEEVKRRRARGGRDLTNPFKLSVVGKSDAHLSAMKQTTGNAIYVDDIPPQHREAYASPVMSTKAHAIIKSIDYSEALEMEGVHGVVDRSDMSSDVANLWGLPKGMEPFFADGKVTFWGQCIALIVAENERIAAAAARKVIVQYEELAPILSIEDAISANSFYDYYPTTENGDVDKAFEESDYVFQGTTRMGSQEHFYLETQGVLVVPESEDGEMKVYSSTQNAKETQEFVANALGVPMSRIVAKVKRLGGGFGGKETRSVALAGTCAIAARKFKRPIRRICGRAEDMATSGQRHPFLTKWKVGLDKNHKLKALDMKIYCNGGMSFDLSGGVIERAVLHADNVYNFQNVRIRGHICKTNIHSNTAFRGFGGPQGMFAAESLMHEVADHLGVELDELREKNIYNHGDKTHFLQDITEDFSVRDLITQVKDSSNYTEKKREIAEFNKNHKWIKQGLSLVPTKFGISFGALHLNQAGALVHVYLDGSILLTHGGIEMGQGIHTKMCMIAAEELQVPLESVFISETSTNTVANTSASAASATSDLNGQAVKNACDQINERLAPYRAKLDPTATMKDLAHHAYMDRVNLSANGFYKTPDIGYVWGKKGAQKPAFLYFTQGAAVTHVEVNMLTGDWACLSTDIKMDIGRPINQAIDYGQIEGAYVQGQGLFTIEESLWMQNGAIFTRGPGAYKIPGFRDTPQVFNVSTLTDRSFEGLKTIRKSRGIGEPPLFLGSSALFAIRDAIKSARQDMKLANKDTVLSAESPMTSERIRLHVGDEILKRATVEPRPGEKCFFVYA